MSRIKSRDTKPEKRVRSLLHRMGYRFRLHKKGMPGHPDIVLPRFQKVVFVHGCFWHGHEGCARASRPSSNKEYWRNKIAKNKARDAQVLKDLDDLGWKYEIVWECETKNLDALAERLERFLQGEEDGEVSGRDGAGDDREHEGEDGEDA